MQCTSPAITLQIPLPTHSIGCNDNLNGALENLCLFRTTKTISIIVGTAMPHQCPHPATPPSTSVAFFVTLQFSILVPYVAILKTFHIKKFWGDTTIFLKGSSSTKNDELLSLQTSLENGHVQATYLEKAYIIANLTRNTLFSYIFPQNFKLVSYLQKTLNLQKLQDKFRPRLTCKQSILKEILLGTFFVPTNFLVKL